MVKYKKVIYYSTKVRGGGGTEAPPAPPLPWPTTDLLRKLKKVPVIGSSKQMTGNREASKWIDGKRMQTSFQGSIGRHRFTFLKKNKATKLD